MVQRFRQDSVKTSEQLVQYKAVDTSARLIQSSDYIEFICCSCDSQGSKKWSEAHRSFKKNGFAYQCPACLKAKYKTRGPQWQENVRKACQTTAKKRTAAENGKKKIKYLPEQIIETINKSGAFYEGDLSSPSNTIRVWWPTGEERHIRIRRFMADGLIERPRVGTNSVLHQQHLKELQDLGLMVEYLSEKRAKITYKNVTWEQYWANHVNQKCRRMMKNIDNGEQIEALVAAGISISKACEALGVDHNRYYRNRKRGIGVMQTALTTKQMERLIEIDGAIYDRQLKPTRYRPDILVQGANLIIEIDGMRFHSEQFKPKKYHFERWNILRALGYNILAFSEYEVKEKRAIVDSMISNKLGKTIKVFARKCQLITLPRKDADAFFAENHLKGAGQGEAYALIHNGKVVCAIRTVKKNNELHISRFCPMVGYSVIGGYSKLLAALPKGLDIVNFVDKRHGTGEHLIQYGFVKASEHIGFEWTDGYYHFNRRKFLGNTGYDHNMLKFWDYGQIKYVKLAN
jgi:very-short-patch-repair endonuclease